MSLSYYVHGVALNQNFTRAFFQRDKEDCEPCKSLAAHVEYGVSSCIFLRTPYTYTHSLKTLFCIFKRLKVGRSNGKDGTVMALQHREFKKQRRLLMLQRKLHFKIEFCSRVKCFAFIPC